MNLQDISIITLNLVVAAVFVSDSSIAPVSDRNTVNSQHSNSGTQSFNHVDISFDGVANQPNENVSVSGFGPKSILLAKYSDIPRSVEVTYLNKYARTLQSEETATGWIVAYGGRRSAADEAEKRGRRAKDYLVDTRGIDAARLNIVDGGYREDPTTELWLAPQGASMPPVSPTVDRYDFTAISRCFFDPTSGGSFVITDYPSKDSWRRQVN